MPWDKQFNVDDALVRAMEAFWSKGYEGVSMQDLVDSMGINRGSMYATFGDKRSLFIQALRLYAVDMLGDYLASVEKQYSPRQAVLRLFADAVESALADDAHNGCFVANTSVELAAHDPEIAEIVSGGLSRTEKFFHRMIVSGQAAGEIPLGVDAADASRALLGLMTGLRVLARSRPEEPLLRAIASQAAAVLG